MSESNALFLTAKQCAERYNISERHFRRLVDQGILPKPMKLGRSARWKRHVLEEYESKKEQKVLKALTENAHSLRYRK
jgi:excisionase family DNA binding protein